ncbi:MAG: DUF3187 family protein [Acidobacteriota bacterium]
MISTRGHRTIIALILVLAVAATVVAEDRGRGAEAGEGHIGYGPFSLRGQSAFQALRLGILPRFPSNLALGEHQLKIGATWSNIWVIDEEWFDPQNGSYGDYFLDHETLDAHVAYAYGVSETMQLEVAYEQRWRFGGGLDGLVENFHDLIGINQNGRDLVPRNGYEIYLDPLDGNSAVRLEDSSKGSFARNVLVAFNHEISRGTGNWPAISYAVTARHSDADPDGGSGWAAALSAGASRRFGRFYLYIAAGYEWYSDDTFLGIELPGSQLTILAATEWRFRPRMSLVFEWLRMQAEKTSTDFFPEISNQIVFGWKWEFRQSGVIEIGMLQNGVPFDGSPDFGWHAAFTQRF